LIVDTDVLMVPARAAERGETRAGEQRALRMAQVGTRAVHVTYSHAGWALRGSDRFGSWLSCCQRASMSAPANDDRPADRRSTMHPYIAYQILSNPANHGAPRPDQGRLRLRERLISAWCRIKR
jgi:hypothetical protein